MSEYICACNKNQNSFIDWWKYCDCKYCFLINENNYIRVRVDNKFAIYIKPTFHKSNYRFEYEEFDFIYNYFVTKKYIEPNIKFESESESEIINYFIKYSNNIIFE